MTQPEVIRVNEDGTPVYADWNSAESLQSVLKDMPDDPPPEAEVVTSQSRAQQEAVGWSAEKRAKIEARLAELNLTYDRQRELLDLPDATLVAGVQRWYSAAETARFFGRTNQWMYDRLRKEKFRYANGDVIEPATTGENGWFRFTLDIIREIALSCYRSGTVKMPELKVIMRRIAEAELNEALFDPEEP